jgi:hypothetical protein
VTIFSLDVLKTMDLHHQMDRLRIPKSLSHDDSAFIYLALNTEIQTYDQMNLVPPHVTPTKPSYFPPYP